MEPIGNIYCNLRTCNKLLDEGYAWITSCSHIFCSEDGEKLFQNALTCPICLKELDSKTELVRIKLKPTEQYRNMILCGQRPEVIIDICNKGLNFWFSQLKQQNDYIKHMIEKEREKRLNLEKSESDNQFLIKQMQMKQEDLKKENEYLKKALFEKNAIIQKAAAQIVNTAIPMQDLNTVSLSPSMVTRMLNMYDLNNNNSNNSNNSTGSSTNSPANIQIHNMMQRNLF